MISFGAVGVISVLANAFPAPFTEMVRDALAGNFHKASQSLFGFLAINPLLYEEGNPVGLKQVLHYLDISSHQVRLPLTPASESLSTRIQAVLKEEKLLSVALPQ
jgi:4-hydroxy-tetrahydrodipicolinate synthase